MIDPYETRKATRSSIVYRQCRTFYGKPKALDAGEARVYANDGYVVLRGFFDALSIARLAEAAGAVALPSGALLSMEPSGLGLRSAVGVHECDPFSGVCFDASLLGIAWEILDSDVYVHQSRINFKLPGIGSGWHWHSDFETWHAQDGMPKMRCFTAMIPLTPNTTQNGSLKVIPGSHRMYWSAPAPEQTFSAEENFADQREGVPTDLAISEIKDRCQSEVTSIVCEPGDLVLFDCNLMHGSVANESGCARTNMFVVFNSVENRLVEPFSYSFRRPEQMAYRGEIT